MSTSRAQPREGIAAELRRFCCLEGKSDKIHHQSSYATLLQRFTTSELTREFFSETLSLIKSWKTVVGEIICTLIVYNLHKVSRNDMQLVASRETDP